MNRNRKRPRRSTPANEHRAVMLDEVLRVLDPQPGEVAVDCTLGLGGHATAILRQLGPAGRLIGIDWDGENLPRAAERLRATTFPFSVHARNFAALPQVLAAESLDAVDLVVADLGMSSMQVDDASRGFSYVRDGPLDMRMDRSRGRSAAQWLAEIAESDLATALREMGDEPQADAIAHAIVRARQQQAIETTAQLARIIGDAVGQPVSRDSGWRLRTAPGRWTTHPAARAFQTLRLLVNRELANLHELLRVLPGCLRPGGRVAIISFHSGEDRIVKAALRDGVARGHYSAVADEPLRASESEKLANPRSRSAKLRWAERRGQKEPA